LSLLPRVELFANVIDNEISQSPQKYLVNKNQIMKKSSPFNSFKAKIFFSAGLRVRLPFPIGALFLMVFEIFGLHYHVLSFVGRP